MTCISDGKNFKERRKNILFALDSVASDYDNALARARALAKEARAKTYYDELGIITDRIRFCDPDDVQSIVYSAQSLVNRGMPFAARDLLLAAQPRVQGGDDVWYEVQGLLGRAAKQIFVDSPDRTSTRARRYLEEGIRAYRTAFDKDPAKAFWHGGNIAGLLTVSKSLGGLAGADADPVLFSGRLKQALEEAAKVDAARLSDYWWHGTYVEAELGARNWSAAAERLKLFLDCASEPFPVESLLRQLTEVWALGGPQAPPMVSAMLELLRVKLLTWTKDKTPGPVEMTAAEIARGTAESPALQRSRDDLQKAFGEDAPLLIDWWVMGLNRAKSIAAICTPDAVGRPARVGTGFLVRLRRSGAGDDAGCFVLTNAHVVGDPDEAAVPSLESATVRFEGYDPEKMFAVRDVIWTSPIDRHDATILKIDGCPADIKPIPLNRPLPRASSGSPLYVIGHSGGNELAFSFRDNRLLDHEGAPEGKPRQQGVVRVHYRTPTTNGNSGSPVFVQNQWRAIALHHSGSAQMQKLNGAAGTYQANEGTSLASISDALAAEKGLELCF